MDKLLLIKDSGSIFSGTAEYYITIRRCEPIPPIPNVNIFPEGYAPSGGASQTMPVLECQRVLPDIDKRQPVSSWLYFNRSFRAPPSGY